MNHVIVLGKAIYPVPGGVERYGYEIAKAYAEKGFTVDLIAGIDEIPSFGRESSQIATHFVSKNARLMALWFMLKFIWVVLTKYRSSTFIHSTTWRMAVLPALLGLDRLVVTVHGNEFLRTDIVSKVLMRGVYKRARLITAVSEYTKNMFENRHGKHVKGVPIVANYNGLTFEREDCRKSPGTLIVLSVCRQTLRKNLKVAIKAVSQILDAGADVEYHLVGTGSQHEALREMIENSGHGNRIFLHGRLSDAEIANHYRRAHVFLHPQRELLNENDMEGFGLVIADGMAKGCVPIIGDNGGARELVETGVNGYRVDPFDAHGIGQHLIELTNDRRLLGRLSDIASSSVQRFSWRNHVQNVMNTLDDSLRFQMQSALQTAKDALQ